MATSSSNRKWVFLVALSFFVPSNCFLFERNAVPSHFRSHSPAVSSSSSQCSIKRGVLRDYAFANSKRFDSSSSLQVSLDDSWEDIATTVSSVSKTVQLSTIAQAASGVRWKSWFSDEWFDAVGGLLSDVARYYADLPIWTEIAVFVIPAAAVAAAALYSLSFPDDDYRAGMEPYERGNYDPIRAAAYYSRHKYLVLQRVLQLLRLSNRFLINLLLDRYLLRDGESRAEERAQELLELVTRLGPTAIKVGQALSVREDIIPKEYAAALSTLQDQVPPFGADEALQILRRELGAPRLSHLKGIGLNQNRDPVASASIGQVYRCHIDDREVAVKVQRPNVLAEIAMDLYIVREFAPIYQRITGSATDLQGLANEWGRGFIQELDYEREAQNTIRFTREMSKRNLNAVCAPDVVSAYSTEQVLVTEWVDGTRLDESDAQDVPRLCAVALNAYLVMLLELQNLHCDPHPGNLLRTKDGKLCILDHGMVLAVDPNLQYSLLEYVAHLTSEDYDQLPEDMVKLGFLKEEKLDFVRRNGILEPLKYFLQQIGRGGGAKQVRERIFDEYRQKYPGLSDDELRVEMRAEMKERMARVVERESVSTGITLEVEELQRQNRDSFRIPEWFLYTSRAFLTLEGVSLQADENYSIIKSCFPYVAKRLVADDDPRARQALRDLLYGAGDAISVKRLSDLADGFTSYTTTTKTINQQANTHDGELVLASGQIERVSKSADRKNRMVEAEAAITLAKDSADVLLAPGGNLVQNLFIQESALAASAQLKDRVRRTVVEGPKRFRDALPLGVGSFLPPLPFEDQVEPFVRKTEEERKAQELAEKLASAIPALEGKKSPSSADADGVNVESTGALVQSLRELDPEQAALVIKELRENLPKYAPLAGRLGGKFLSTLLKTASSNIETTLTDLELSGKEPDGVTKATVRGLSSVAQRGATALSQGDDQPSMVEY